MPDHLPLSVVIISLNEEQRIGDCIASVRELTNDVIVIDAHSTDRTVEIAEAHGARVFARTWTGYSDQKNHGNEMAHHDWILSLDADERVTPELAASIRAEFARGQFCDAYDLPFRNYFGLTLVRFGAWNPESHVRLFDRRKLAWNCNEVHEGLRDMENMFVGKLTGCVRHYTVDSYEQLANKTQRYSALFAEKLRRQRRRPSWWKVWLNPAFRFARDYLFRGGLLDGRAGLAIAWESARYTHLKYWLALPPPKFRGRSAWAMGGASLTAATVFAVVVISSGGARWEASPSRRDASVVPPMLNAAGGNDGFDNNPVVPAPPSQVDDDVLS